MKKLYARMAIVSVMLTANLLFAGWALAQLSPELREALDYHKSGKLKEAIEVYGEVLKKQPNMAEALNWRGMAYDDIGDPDKALADLNKAVELSPNYADAYNNRGEVHRKKKMFPQAMADYRKALSLDKDFAEASFNIAFIHESQQRKDQAAAEYGNYLRIRPNAPDKEELEKKIQELKKAAAQTPGPPPQAAPTAAPAPGTPPAAPGAPPTATAPQVPGQPPAAPLPPGMQPPSTAPGTQPPGAFSGMPKKPGAAAAIPGMPDLPLGLDPVKLISGLDILGSIVSLAFYLISSFLLFMIAKKTNTSLPWLAFIPIANIYLMVRIARKPVWWLALLLSPILMTVAVLVAAIDPTGGILPMVLIAILTLVCAGAWLLVSLGIASARGKSVVWGVLLFIPCTHPIALAYLGLSK